MKKKKHLTLSNAIYQSPHRDNLPERPPSLSSEEADNLPPQGSPD